MSITIEEHQTTTEAAATGDAPAIPTVTIFSKNNCPYCVSTKARLTARGVPFREINVQEDTAPRAEFGGKTPMEHVVGNYGTSMPAVVIKDGPADESWTGSRPDRTLALIQRFEAIGATIPVEERAAHASHL